jgi:hypothetical protein
VDKKLRLPKEAFIDGQDVEGHGSPPADGAAPDGESLRPFEATPDGKTAGAGGDALLSDDVEGHRLMQNNGDLDADDFTILPAPPSIGLRRTPGHGGE